MKPSWVEVDWSANWLPTEDQVQQSLRHLRFEAVPVEADPVIRLVDSFRTMLTNGGAHVAAFDVVEADDVAAWFLSRNRDEYTLADQLLRSEAFAGAIPNVATAGPIGDTTFKRMSSLTLDGHIAQALQCGCTINWSRHAARSGRSDSALVSAVGPGCRLGSGSSRKSPLDFGVQPTRHRVATTGCFAAREATGSRLSMKGMRSSGDFWLFRRGRAPATHARGGRVGGAGRSGPVRPRRPQRFPTQVGFRCQSAAGYAKIRHSTASATPCRPTSDISAPTRSLTGVRRMSASWSGRVSVS